VIGPELAIEGRPRLRLATAAAELWRYRSTLLAFVERDVRVKYKQAALGITWAVLQPLAFMGIFTVTLGRLGGVSGGGAPYPVLALAALVPWTFMQTGVAFASNSLLSDASLLRKVYFPRELPVLGSVLGSGVDFGVGLMLFAVIGLPLGAHLSFTWLLAPLLGIVLMVFAAGMSCVLAALNVYYRDFRYAVPIMLQLWMFASPVAYPISVVPSSWRPLYVALNPPAGVLDGFRRALAVGTLPDGKLLAISAASSIFLGWVGYRVFKRLEPSFADVV
jgi:ABC-type polysaccharide/polyol phosphate export permease